MINKVVRLDKDRVFQNAVEFNDQKNYEGDMIMPCSVVSDAVKDHANGVRDAIFDLMLAGKLDKTDLQIIQARDCSPMPSIRGVARKLKIDVATVSRRAQHMRALIHKAFAAQD